MYGRLVLRHRDVSKFWKRCASPKSSVAASSVFETSTPATVRSFGSRGARGHGWLHHYRAGNKGRHLQGRYHYRDIEKRAAINDSMFELGTSKCYIDLAVDQLDEERGSEEDGAPAEPERKRVYIELASKALPRTCENFLKLIEDGYYNDTKVNRIEKNVGVCLGELVEGGGGQCHPDISPYGIFEHESYVISHIDEGILTMLSPGVDKNNSQFAILLNDAPQLDGRMTAFGRLKREEGSSLRNLEEIVQSVFTAKGVPLRDIKVVGSGVS